MDTTSLALKVYLILGVELVFLYGCMFFVIQQCKKDIEKKETYILEDEKCCSCDTIGRMKMWALWNYEELFTVNTCTKSCARRIKLFNCKLIPMVHISKLINHRRRIASDIEEDMALHNIKIKLHDYLLKMGIIVPLDNIASWKM